MKNFLFKTVFQFLFFLVIFALNSCSESGGTKFKEVQEAIHYSESIGIEMDYHRKKIKEYMSIHDSLENCFSSYKGEVALELKNLIGSHVSRKIEGHKKNMYQKRMRLIEYKILIEEEGVHEEIELIK